MIWATLKDMYRRCFECDVCVIAFGQTKFFVGTACYQADEWYRSDDGNVQGRPPVVHVSDLSLDAVAGAGDEHVS